MSWPPAAWSARLASKRAWYSGVRGACCAGPHPLVGSKVLNRPPRTPATLALGPRRHCPFRSGYLVSSNACKARSEEHTSELQSRQYLVCRLLLEKKKKKQPKNCATQDT